MKDLIYSNTNIQKIKQMAKKAKIELILDLADKLTGKLGKLEGKVTKWQGKMKGKLDEFSDKVASKFGMTGESLQRGIKVGAVAGIAALTMLGTKGVQAASKFDSAFLPIQNLNLDKSKSELESYRSSIRDASYDIGTNIKDSTNAMYDLQSATGLYGKDAIDVFKKVGKYSIATGANINDAMNSTTKAMKAFGLGVDDIDKLLTSNAKTVQVGITTFDELAKVQTEYAGAAASAGQGVDQANKVFAMFTSVAKNSDVGATMAKTFFQGLGQQADKFESELGVNVFDAKGSMRNADAILKDISGKFKNMTDKEITQAINKIGGPEGLRGALSKVKTGADDMIATFNAFDSSKFSLADALKNAQGDFATMKKMFSNRLEMVFTKIGEKIIPMLANLFDRLTPVLNFLYQNMDWLLPVFSTFVGILSLATAGMWLFNFAVSANPISLIIIAIAALITLVVMAIAKFDSWGSSILLLMGPFGMIINAIMMLYRHWESIKKAFNDGGIIGGLKRIGLVLLDTLMHPLQRILEMISKIPGMGNIAGGLSKDLKSFREKMKLISPEEKQKEAKEKENDKNKKSLLGDKTDNPITNLTKGSGGVKGAIQKVTGAKTSGKNIKIIIDALHKGDNNLRGASGKQLSMKEYETMFEEMIMRIIRNAELS